MKIIQVTASTKFTFAKNLTFPHVFNISSKCFVLNWYFFTPLDKNDFVPTLYQHSNVSWEMSTSNQRVLAKSVNLTALLSYNLIRLTSLCYP